MSSSTNTNFKQYLVSAKPKGVAIPAGLQDLLLAVVNTCSTLSHEVAQGALIGLLGSAGSGNVQGEVQQKLDIIANDQLMDGVKGCKSLAGLASEEMELPAQPPIETVTKNNCMRPSAILAGTGLPNLAM